MLLKALAKKPEDRYPTCTAFVEALAAAVLPRRPPPPPRLARRAIARRGGRRRPSCAGVPVVRARGPAVVDDADAGRAAGPATGGAGGRRRARTGPGSGTTGDRAASRDATVTAILIPETGADDPPTFYLMRDKVTNRVFDAAWKAAEENPESALNRYRRSEDLWLRGTVNVPQLGPTDGTPTHMIQGRWRSGVLALLDHKPLGIDREQLAVPVVGVTTMEAALIALDLGGRLPNFKQWNKAAGSGEPGWDGPEVKDPADLARFALKRDVPLPVTVDTPDLSPHGVQKLGSNGTESDPHVRGQRRTGPAGGEAGRVYMQKFRAVGQMWIAASPLRLSRQKLRHNYWNETKPMNGFRVVIEQPW